MSRERPTAADAFSIDTWTSEAEEVFQRQLEIEERGDEPCYFCGSSGHRLTECPERP